MKSAYASTLDLVQKALARSLKPLGFRTRGRDFNRPVEEGVEHVISLFMARPEIGPERPPEVRALVPDHYGQCALELGVYVAEVNDGAGPVKGMARNVHCMIRACAQDRSTQRQIWWRLDRDPEAIAQDMLDLIAASGFAWLDHFSSREKIIGTWVAYADGVFDPDWYVFTRRRARLDVALMLAAQGRSTEARSLLEEQIRRSTNLPAHVAYVHGLAKKLGIPLP